jgi:hypothetical protein
VELHLPVRGEGQGALQEEVRSAPIGRIGQPLEHLARGHIKKLNPAFTIPHPAGAHGQDLAVGRGCKPLDVSVKDRECTNRAAGSYVVDRERLGLVLTDEGPAIGAEAEVAAGVGEIIPFLLEHQSLPARGRLPQAQS